MSRRAEREPDRDRRRLRDRFRAGPERADRSRRHGRDRVRAPRILGLVVASIALAAVLFLFVLPTRTYLAQRHSLTAEQARLHVFDAQNGALSAQAQQLQTNSDVERIAEQRYGLVLPGHPDVVALPSATPAATKPKARPTRGLWYRLWHDVQFWN